VAGGAVFVALVCLWASYFGGAESLFSEDVSATTDPITAIRRRMNVTYRPRRPRRPGRRQ
jgi:ABC-type transporter Mla subunit MlaD